MRQEELKAAEQMRGAQVLDGEDKSLGAPRTLLPGQTTIGVLGGGQLGRMMALDGIAMGYRFVALDPAADAPCGQVTPQITAAYNDQGAARELAQRADVITYEFENVDAGVAALLTEESYVPQGSALLYTTQHRLREKAAIEAAGVPVAPYRKVGSLAELTAAAAELGLPCVLKTATGGYDGKGQAVIRQQVELEAAFRQVAPGAAEGAEVPELVLEKFVKFQCEISVIAARSASGEVKSFPPAENIHVNNILHLSIVPARVAEEIRQRACELAERLVTGLDAVGLLAVEMFVTEDGDLFVNELAPRPHNSGHYTMDACATSQFEQHIRAICNLPLGDTTLLTPVVMVNVLGEHLDGLIGRTGQADEAAGKLGVAPKLHIYGKTESKTGRKMGHVNLLCKDTGDGLSWVEQTNLWRN
ncbi:5-(carboxyamino)imidazole ribonucleotide synthase [Paenibacillus sp. PastF-1]|nr:5-(carboxyamino)imidazole ribonucleotide synthase [Paenibacillus sp. PastF-2]MDF9851190.1 5-(carboxyamino)imidazole ribonucleotide synthase [Paenibacillus sp. PastM-2]MDF9857818.1 5-(carboxyamino)imidazole ribonucleotide synthase [Paenibacillus sp. PastF-1]MDH6483039.1 5-(carboxyamino)imidazole ribonucleotide synthase [Paenibacillus sp. PastH-2]MDH6510496.1 5-(carboxyamino)imidazole ribonucleotide synthase [Paenibacillus sp. PastM-3]